MKASIVALVAVACLAAVSGSSRVLAARASSETGAGQDLVQLPPAAPAGETTQWGHIKTLVRKGGHFELRFDPGWLLKGVTASRAALEDTGSGDVPNDAYTVEEGHRLLTYVVKKTAHVTVLVNGPRPVAITVSELARIIKGENPRQRPLFGSVKASGFWIRVGSTYPNAVLSLDQQYQP